MALLLPALLAALLAAEPEAPEDPVRGRVVEADDGAGLFGLEVGVVLWRSVDAVGSGAEGLERSETVTTDAEGRFASAGAFDTARTTVSLYDPATARALGVFGAEELRSRASEGGVWRLEVDLGPTVHVRPTGTDGPPPGGGRVRIVDEAADARRAWPWRALRAGPVPWARYPFDEAPLPGATRWVEVETRDLAHRGRAPLPGGPATPERAARVELLPLAAVRGSVTLADDVDPDELRLDLVPAGSADCPEKWRRARIDPDGSFEVRGLDPGRWSLVLRGGRDALRRVLTLEPGTRETESLVLPAPAAGSGILAFPSDLPATFAVLSAEGEAPRLVVAGDGPGALERTVEGLGESVWEVRVHDVEGGRWESVRLAAGGRAAPAREAPETRRLALAVAGEGEPLVQVTAPGAWWPAARRAGAVTLGAAPVELAVGAPGAIPAFVVPEAGAERLELDLEPGWGVRLHVRDARDPLDPEDPVDPDSWAAYALSRFDGPPLAGARVLLDGEPAGTTDARGTALVRADEPPGVLEVELEGWTLVANPLVRCGRVDPLALEAVVWMVPVPGD